MRSINTNPPAVVAGSEADKAIGALMAEHHAMGLRYREARRSLETAERGAKDAAAADAVAAAAALRSGAKDPGDPRVTANKAEQEKAKRDVAVAEQAMVGAEDDIESLLRQHGGEAGDWTADARRAVDDARLARQVALAAYREASVALATGEAAHRWLASRGDAKSVVVFGRTVTIGSGGNAVQVSFDDVLAALARMDEPPAPVKTVAPELAAVAAR